MKNIIIILLLAMLQSQGFSQSSYQKIRISKDIELLKISDNAYIHVSYSKIGEYGRIASNGMIYTNGDEAYLFDTPCTDSLTMDLCSWIKDSLKAKVVGFVPNHWHIDCMGGLGYLKKIGVESYAYQKTIDIAMAKKLPVPAHGFKDSLQLKLGNRTIECYYLGAAHSMDNIVVWIPSEKILFAGCMVKSLDMNTMGNIKDGDLRVYPETLDRLMEKFPDAKVVIPGHGLPGGIDLIKHTRELAIKNK
jgi:metallo-beta-lactamase class B